MAASAGTNPGSTPDGVGVDDGDSLGEGIADGVAEGEGEAVKVSDDAGLIAAVGVHPPIRMATATTGKPRLIRRSEVPTACLYDEAGVPRPPTRTPGKKMLAYPPRQCPTPTTKTAGPFALRPGTFIARGGKQQE